MEFKKRRRKKMKIKMKKESKRRRLSNANGAMLWMRMILLLGWRFRRLSEYQGLLKYYR